MKSGRSMTGGADADSFNIDNESLTPIAAGAARRTITKLPFGLLVKKN